MTAKIYQLTIQGMASPGRRVGTPREFREEFAKRISAAREKIEFSQAQMAAELSRRSGRNIVADSYRKWEAIGKKQNSLLPHDLIAAFCDITRTHPFELLAAVPFSGAQRQPADRRRRAA